MAQALGRAAYFSVEDAAGTTLRNITPFLTSVQFVINGETIEGTSFGDDWREFSRGLAGAEIEIEGRWDDTATTGPDAVLAALPADKDGTVGFEFGPKGNAVSSPKFSGECWCTNYTQSAELEDVVAFSASFTVSGVVTKGVF